MENSAKVRLAVEEIYPELIRGGTKIRVRVGISEEPPNGGGMVTVWVEPSDSIARITEAAMIEVRRLFAADIIS